MQRSITSLHGMLQALKIILVWKRQCCELQGEAILLSYSYKTVTWWNKNKKQKQLQIEKSHWMSFLFLQSLQRKDAVTKIFIFFCLNAVNNTKLFFFLIAHLVRAVAVADEVVHLAETFVQCLF